MDIFTPILTFIVNTFLFDMAIFSNIWLYIPLGIPFFLYTIFFFFKWWLITAPIWIPLSAIFKPYIISNKTYNKSSKNAK